MSEDVEAGISRRNLPGQVDEYVDVPVKYSVTISLHLMR